MRNMTSMYMMNTSADARFAPACQSASMTARRWIVLDTALLAVSFFFGIIRGLEALGVRIMGSAAAKP